MTRLSTDTTAGKLTHCCGMLILASGLLSVLTIVRAGEHHYVSAGATMFCALMFARRAGHAFVWARAALDEERRALETLRMLTPSGCGCGDPRCNGPGVL